MRIIICVIFLVSVIGCGQVQKKTTNENYVSGQLVHTVLLKLKDNVSSERAKEVMELIETLSQIEEANGLFVASPADTPDPRAVQNYDFILQMAFNSIEELTTYSTNEYHLKVRSQIKNDLSATPLVFDYWVN